jgi:hypothetical protein
VGEKAATASSVPRLPESEPVRWSMNGIGATNAQLAPPRRAGAVRGVRYGKGPARADKRDEHTDRDQRTDTPQRDGEDHRDPSS